jgi:hypothetical protein
MKVDRSRIVEYLGGQEGGDVDNARRVLPLEVDTERDRELLEQCGVDVDHLLDGLGKGGLGKMIGG